MEASGDTARAAWLVDDLRVDAGARSVTRGEDTITLPRLSFELLLALVEAAPNALSTDEIMDRVWRRTVVSPTTVSKRVELLREALGDNSDEPRYVALVRGYGYKLVPQPRREASPPAEGRPPPGPGQTARHRPWLRTGLTALAIVAMLITTGVLLFRSGNETLPAPALTIAVLPFQSIGDDPEDQLFADGLTEELAHSLARTGSLRVAGRSSSFRFRDSGAGSAEIGEILGVAHLLEGSVRRSDDQLRVVARLTDSAGGLQRWSGTWERALDDVLAIQREVADRVARELEAKLTASPAGDGPETNSSEAYTLFLKAMSLMEYPTGSDLPRAQVLLERAVTLDPGFARAWAHLGAVHLRRALWNEPTYTLTPGESTAVARDAIDRALAADPANGWPYVLLAGLAWSFENDIGKAAQLAEQSVRLGARDLDVLKFYADLYKTLGQFEPARAIEAHILLRDPLCGYCRQQHVDTLNALGDHDAAEREARMLLSMGSESPAPVWLLGRSLLLAGAPEEALRTFEQIGNLGAGQAGLAMASHALGRSEDAARFAAAAQAALPGPRGLVTLAKLAAWTGRHQRALALLDEAVDHPNLRAMLQVHYVDPTFDSLRGTPGWDLFLERIGRSPEQLRTVQFDVLPYLDIEE